MEFKIGDRVAITPHRSRSDDGQVVDDLATVTNPNDPTDMARLDGTPVGYYVRVKRDKQPGDPNAGYHAASLGPV